MVDNVFKKKKSSKEDAIVLWSHRGMEDCISKLYRLNIESPSRITLEVCHYSFDTLKKEVRIRDTVQFNLFNDALIDALYSQKIQ